MAKTIKSKSELEKVMLHDAMTGLTNELAERVYETLNYFLQEYYNVYQPRSYRRTMDFLYSAVKTDAEVVGNKVTAFVYIDLNALDNYDISGEQVVDWANQGLHGGLDVGDSPRVWDETIENTIESGELLKLAAQYLRNKGFRVKV